MASFKRFLSHTLSARDVGRKHYGLISHFASWIILLYIVLFCISSSLIPRVMLDEKLDNNLQSHICDTTPLSTLAAGANEVVPPESCVICLETISEKAAAYPCKHDNFDFICLASWVQEKSSCPLCKAVITAIHYTDCKGRPRIYKVESLGIPASETSSSGPSSASSSAWIQQFRGQRPPSRQFGARGRKRPRLPSPSDEAILARRRRIYELDLYSLHVGSNRLSGYSDLTPSRFANDPHLVSRARKWIRRELLVLGSLTDRQESSSTRTSSRISAPRTRLAGSKDNFLLEYIVAILKTVDIKGSTGQAQEMLAELLGRKSALFLHELNSWLRSPFEELAVWDRNVRYEWPSGEERALDRRSRETIMATNEDGPPFRKRRMYDRWIPD